MIVDCVAGFADDDVTGRTKRPTHVTRSTEAHPTPGLLRWARESAGLSCDDVAQRNKIEVEDLRAWEDGQRSLPVTRLRDLAATYKRPFVVFYLPAVPSHEREPTDFRSVRGGSPHEFPTDLRFALRQARLIGSAVADATGGEARRAELPRATPRSDASVLAASLRSLLGVTPELQRSWRDPEHAFGEWRRRIESLGIVTLQLPFRSSDARGFSLRTDGWCVIAVSAHDAKPAKSFTLFHELTHLCLGEDGVCKALSPFVRASTPQFAIEQFCNDVAGRVLVPSTLLSLLVPEALLGLPALDAALRRLVRECRVSHEVALRRLAAEELVDQRSYVAKMRDLRAFAAARRADELRRREERKQPVRIDVARMRASALGHLALRALVRACDAGRLTEADVAGTMDIRLKHLPELRRIAME